MDVTSTSKKNAPSLITRILSILGMNRGPVQSSSNQTEESVRLNIGENYNSWKATEIALLEAERARAKAEELMQRRTLI